MFEVMTLLTCDGPPGGGGWVRQTTQGRRQLWRWSHTSTAPGCATEKPGLIPVRPGGHSADMNEPGVDTPGENRWNPAVLLRRAAPVRL